MNSIVVEKYPASFGQVAKLIELLERRGINRAEIQHAIDDPRVADKVADAMRINTIPALESVTVLNQAGIDRTIRHALGRQIRHSKRLIKDGGRWFARTTDGFEPFELFYPLNFRQMLEGLDGMTFAVLALRNGLLDGEVLPAGVVAERLKIEGRTVSTLLKKANRHIQSRQAELLPLFDMRPYHFDHIYEDGSDYPERFIADVLGNEAYAEARERLLNAGITTLGQLVALSKYQAARLLLGPEVYLPQEHFPRGRIVHTS